MLQEGHVPHEYGEYAKLLKKIGFDAKVLAALETTLKRENPYVVRFYKYFEKASQTAK